MKQTIDEPPMLELSARDDEKHTPNLGVPLIQCNFVGGLFAARRDGELQLSKARFGSVMANDCSWPILLKNSASADGRKILALIRPDARVDVEDRKELLISRPSSL